LLDGHCKKNIRRFCSPVDARKSKVREMDAVTVWMEMNDMDLRPDVICYTVLIDWQCKTDNLKDAIALFDEMIDRGLEPDTVTYTALLSEFCKKGYLDRAETLYSKMSSEGILSDTITISVLHRHGIIIGKTKEVQF
jgi:pentatricopeptide repeat protein